MEANLAYAHSLEAPQGYLDRKKSFLSGDFEASELINEELPVSMSVYYGEVRDNDDLVWDRLLISKRLLEARGRNCV